MKYQLLTVYLSLRNTARKTVQKIKGIIGSEKTKTKYSKWVSYNKKIFQPRTPSSSKMILCDVFMVPEWLFVNAFAINELCKKFNCTAASFGNIPRNSSENEVYSSFGVNTHLVVKLSSAVLKKRHKILFNTAKQQVNSKETLFNFEIDGVHIGVDIYESILRTGVPTVDINSLTTWQNIYIGLEYYVYFDSLFSEDKIQAMMLSHDNYIYMGIPSKLGFKFKVSSYLFNANEFLCLTRPNELHDRFNLFPDLFNRLSENEKRAARNWSKEQLEKRLKGQVGVEMQYQQKSAFTFEKVNTQVLNNGKTNIVVATHEFYDNPHGYGGLLFLDFYEWLIFLGELSQKGKYNWYLKPHRDVAESELTQLNKICKLYPNFILLDKEYTFHQLREEGVDVALTCYGTIGHELPFLGYKVINAGNNPHMAYGFNFHPKNVQEYRQILLGLDTLKVGMDKNEVYEFFYTYKKIIYSIDFSVNNYFPLNETRTDDIIADFIMCSDQFKNEIEKELEKFINSGVTYSFLLN
jgi:hypothetical protein